MTMTNHVDFPLEVSLVDGTKWLIYYRSVPDFGTAMIHVCRDVAEGRLMPADDIDGVQRRSAQINMRYIVSIKDASGGAAA